MRSDLEALQGSWQQVAFEENGVANPPDDFGGTPLTTFHQSRFAVWSPDGKMLLEGRFELDETANPKTVNWIDATGPDAGKLLPAIYTLEGDRFTFIAADAGAPRPTEFRTGPDQTMRTFARKS